MIRTLAIVAGGITVAGCGLEASPGALPGAPGPPVAEHAQGAGPTRATTPDATWQHLELGEHVVVWLPVGSGWTLTAQGRAPGGGSFVRLAHEEAAVGVVAQSLSVRSDLSAAALCASGLREALADRGVVAATPQPVGNPHPRTALVGVFTCSADHVTSPDGPQQLLMDVVVRNTDGTAYTQLVTSPADERASTPAVVGAVDTSREMLARTVAGLEQR